MSKFLAIAGTFLVATLFWFGSSFVQDTSKIHELERSPDRGKLTWHAQLAKAKGLDKVLLRSSIVDYAVSGSFDDAVANCSLVIAEPFDSRSYATTYDIETWYKFRIVEELSAPASDCTGCSPAVEPPMDLLPLGTNEFLSSKIGGEVTVDGVPIISSDPSFPDFQMGKRYLLLVVFDSKKVVGTLRSGPWGVFALDSDEKLRSVNAELKDPFREKLLHQFGNSLPNLKRSLKRE
jgi:hypothetical protein